MNGSPFTKMMQAANKRPVIAHSNTLRPMNYCRGPRFKPRAGRVTRVRRETQVPTFDDINRSVALHPWPGIRAGQQVAAAATNTDSCRF